jgi:hypothetical protein
MCRPDSNEDVTNCHELVQSVRDGTHMRPHDCPAVQRLKREEENAS